MAPKNNPRNWNDVQTAIATVAIVTTLGMWNLFAAPAPKKEQPQATQPPVEDIPLSSFTNSTPTAIPQVKIFFAPNASQQSVSSQPQQQQQQQTVTRKQKNKNNGGGGGGTVTKTRTS